MTMVSRGSSEAAGLLDAQLRTSALRFVVRQMGNGVDRLEAYSLIPIEQAEIERGLPDRSPMPIPFPGWILDLGVAALDALGHDGSEAAGWVWNACARSIDDAAIEVIAWKVT